MKLLPAFLIIFLKTFDYVYSRDYNYIPKCNERVNLHSMVHNSLLTYFEIYRGLFCVLENDSGRDITYVTTLSSSEATIQSTKLQSEFTDEQKNWIDSSELQKFVYYTKSGTTGIFKLPKGSGAQKRDLSIEWRQPYYFERSGEIYTSLSSWCTSGTLADPTYFSGVTFQSLNNTSSSAITPTVTYYNYNANGVYTAESTPGSLSLSGTVCSNLQVFNQFEITYNTSDEISVVAIRVYWITSMDYATTGSVLGTHGFDILNKDSSTTGETFYSNGTPGYNMTDPTIIGTITTSNNVFAGVTAEIPVFQLSVSDSDGNCLGYDSTGYFWSDRNSVVEFGVNKVINCKYTATSSSDFTSNCANLNIYYVDTRMTGWSKYGIANVNYQSDWIEASVGSKPSFTTSTTSCSVIRPNINVFYQKFGKIENPRYQISKIDISFETITLAYSSGTIDYSQSMTINWFLISSEKNMHKPDLPSAKTYLSNYVLYPFYVSRSYITISLQYLLIVTLQYQIN